MITGPAQLIVSDPSTMLALGVYSTGASPKLAAYLHVCVQSIQNNRQLLELLLPQFIVAIVPNDIPIVDNEIILRDQPDYIIILAWHYGEYIMKNWRAKGVKAKFVVPLPEFKIIS